MNEMELVFLEGRKVILEILELLDQGKREHCYRRLGSGINQIQQVILLLSEGGFISVDEINQMSLYLVQAIENQDSVLLRDVLKYALLDAVDQILSVDGEE